MIRAIEDSVRDLVAHDPRFDVSIGESGLHITARQFGFWAVILTDDIPGKFKFFCHVGAGGSTIPALSFDDCIEELRKKMPQ